jgi:hypothetical protein
MKMHPEYVRRDEILFDMGFSSYRAYLDSPWWKGIRARVIERAKGKCFACDSRAVEVHHREYSRPVLEGKALNRMVALCVQCHKVCEYAGDGRKLTLAEANARLQELVDAQANPAVDPPVDWKARKASRRAAKREQREARDAFHRAHPLNQPRVV